MMQVGDIFTFKDRAECAYGEWEQEPHSGSIHDMWIEAYERGARAAFDFRDEHGGCKQCGAK